MPTKVGVLCQDSWGRCVNGRSVIPPFTVKSVKRIILINLINDETHCVAFRDDNNCLLITFYFAKTATGVHTQHVISLFSTLSVILCRSHFP